MSPTGGTSESPITEHRSWGPAVIEPSEHVARAPGMPAAVVMCFFTEVLERATANAPVVAAMSWAHAVHRIWVLDVDGQQVGVMHPGVGAPLSAGLFEGAIAHGGSKFVAVGGCGALVPDLALGHVIVPTAAIRDEGTSYHYLPPSRTVKLDPAVADTLTGVLDRHHTPYVRGLTWTTDAPYRETREIVDRRTAEGAIVVEMETAAFAAVARRRSVAFGQLLYAGDDLAGEVYDTRDWTRAHDVRETLFWLAVEAALAL
jgi:uridine phosphorylase